MDGELKLRAEVFMARKRPVRRNSYVNNKYANNKQIYEQ